MADFLAVARLDQVVREAGTRVTIEDDPVALFNVAGRIFAVGDSCLRCGSSLAAGTLRGTEVTCSGCDWSYDVTTGAVKGLPAMRAETREVRINGTHVLIAIADAWSPPNC